MSEFLEPRWPLTPKQSLLVGIFVAGIWLAVDVFLMRLEQDEISSRANPAILVYWVVWCRFSWIIVVVQAFLGPKKTFHSSEW